MKKSESAERLLKNCLPGLMLADAPQRRLLIFAVHSSKHYAHTIIS